MLYRRETTFTEPLLLILHLLTANLNGKSYFVEGFVGDFLCSPKGEHIIATFSVRPSVTLLSGAYLKVLKII